MKKYELLAMENEEEFYNIINKVMKEEEYSNRLEIKCVGENEIEFNLSLNHSSEEGSSFNSLEEAIDFIRYNQKIINSVILEERPMLGFYDSVDVKYIMLPSDDGISSFTTEINYCVIKGGEE